MEYCWEKDGFFLRSARNEEAEAYYAENFSPLDAEVARLTGSKTQFTREEIIAYFRRFETQENGYLFLLHDPSGRIIGESVINEIDREIMCANFRIAMFRPDFRGRGLGTWVTKRTRDFAFEVLMLHRLELNVFSFNPCAQRVYEKAGFRIEGIRRDAIRDGDTYADDILMALLEGEWRTLPAASEVNNISCFSA
ncbi:MAG: GNAT family N-acetyltransferase [Faecousia sp.]